MRWLDLAVGRGFELKIQALATDVSAVFDDGNLSEVTINSMISIEGSNTDSNFGRYGLNMSDTEQLFYDLLRKQGI